MYYELMNKNSISRRDFLRFAAGSLSLALPLLAGQSRQAMANMPDRSLALYNLHTGETLKTTFWQDGQYVDESLHDINHFMRDFRQNEVKSIDTKLIDLLFDIKTDLDSSKPIHVISGYRSPKTNKLLKKQGRKVATRSMHLHGKAVDIYLPDRKLSEVKKVATSAKIGGVGYYPKSSFVHLDTGRVRYW